MRKLFVAILLIACCIFASSCVKKTDAGQGPAKIFDMVKVQKPLYYGNGVYHFKCTEREFAVSIASFLSDSTKYVQGLVSDGMGVNGYDAGYFVVIDCPERYPIKNIWDAEIICPTYYGYGLWYFDCTGMDFAISLTNFLFDETKRVQSITVDKTGSNGYDVGYFVIVDLPDL